MTAVAPPRPDPKGRTAPGFCNDFDRLIVLNLARATLQRYKRIVFAPGGAPGSRAQQGRLPPGSRPDDASNVVQTAGEHNI